MSTENSVTITRVIAATPERLYRAWLTAYELEQWMANDAEVDAVVGGQYTLTWKLEEGTFQATGRYLELEPARKIVQTWVALGPDGPAYEGETTISIEFRDLGNGSTEITQVESGPGLETEEQRAESAEGSTAVYDALEAVVTA